MVQEQGGEIRMTSIRIKKERPSASTTLKEDVPG